MPFTEDLDGFLSTSDFAYAATLQGGSTVNVIFDEDYVSAMGEVVSSNPACLAKASAISTSNVGQSLTINSVAYTIRARELVDDGSFVRLQLEKN